MLFLFFLVGLSTSLPFQEGTLVQGETVFSQWRVGMGGGFGPATRLGQGVLSCLFVGRDCCPATSVTDKSVTVLSAPAVQWALNS